MLTLTAESRVKMGTVRSMVEETRQLLRENDSEQK